MKAISIRIVQILFFLPLLCQNSTAQKVSKESAWQKIAPYFAVPDPFKDQYGEYRSPLKFYDGKTVKNPADWTKRRAEILERWNGMMGKWPALITDQKLEILESSRRDGFTQYLVRFSWIPGQKTNAYLLVPDGKGKKPAVITVYYEPETAAGLGRPDLPDRDFAYQLCKRGFVTLSIGTTETTNSKTYALYYPGIQNASVQPLSMLAYAAANAWNVLAKIPEVDSKRIGIMGHSYGGKWAMFASCMYEKFACAVWSDAGIVFEDSRESINYWEPWYLGYHPQPWRKRGLITVENPAKGLYPRLISEGYNLQELHVLMAPRPFLVSGGSEDRPDRWIPLNHT
ncbi:MAG: prolyl oligopeptidase family serine peptidase, partial [Pedobacter sp.]